MGLQELAERLLKLGIYTMSKEEAVAMIEECAKQLNLDLSEADLEKTREILSKGKPMAEILTSSPP